MELMVAMAITTIIVTVLVSITSIALDTWNRSRSELRASRQAKSMLDVMTRDFESLVTRKGNVSEWLSAKIPGSLPGDKNLLSTNAAELMFFCSPTDRYDGGIGTTVDKGGDVSLVAYQLDYRDPIGKNGEFKTFVLNRLLVNPDDTFSNLLGKTDMTKAIQGISGLGNIEISSVFPYKNKLEDSTNFVCENIYQFSLTFRLNISKSTTLNGITTTISSPFSLTLPRNRDPSADQLSITGGGVVLQQGDVLVTKEMDGFTREDILGAKVEAVEISVTVISDFGVDQIKRRKFSGNQQAEFLAKNSYQYTKLVQISSM